MSREAVTAAMLIATLGLSGCGVMMADLAGPGIAHARIAAAPSMPGAEFLPAAFTAGPGDKQADDKPVTPPKADPARAGQRRAVVYTGILSIVVRSADEAADRVVTIAERAGGHLHSMDGSIVTVRVPADRFRECVAEVARLGEVVRREIRGADVTDELRDLGTRLKNAEAVRDRLAGLLDMAATVEDALKIEKELARVAGEIEVLKGRLAHLADSVAFSTLTVRLNSRAPAARKKPALPFEWVRTAGADLLSGDPGGRAWRRPRRSWLRFDLPGSYVKYQDHPGTVRAMSGADVYVKIQRHENYEGGDAEFWTGLLRRELVGEKAFAVVDKGRPFVITGADALMLSATKELGGKEYGYLLAVVTNARHVYTFEAWGPAADFAKDRERLVDAVESMRVPR
ncbi:MAG: DUF4349 domain-containing protein [Planctomycetota bacterium]